MLLEVTAKSLLLNVTIGELCDTLLSEREEALDGVLMVDIAEELERK